MTADGAHGGLADVSPIAEIPFGLLDQPLRDGIAGLEQELRLDHRVARVDVEAIGEPVERLVLALRVVIEDRQDVDVDRPDPVTERLELCDSRGRALEALAAGSTFAATADPPDRREA